MTQEFYIEENGKQVGPFSYDELKTKGIKHDTLVWTEGFETWTKAENVVLLKELFRSTPPPLPKTGAESKFQETPSNSSKVTPPDKYFGYELAKRSTRLFATIVETILISIPFFIIYGSNNFLFDSDYSLIPILANTVFSAICGALFYPIWSGNLGHKIFGLKVISAINGADQNKSDDGAIREALKSVLSYLIIPIIWLLWDDNKQNIYDKVAKTYVVKKVK